VELATVGAMGRQKKVPRQPPWVLAPESWTAFEWEPLLAAVERFWPYVGDWRLASDELHKRLLSGDVQSTIIMSDPVNFKVVDGYQFIPLPGAPPLKILPAPDAWHELVIRVYSAEPFAYLRGKIGEREAEITWRCFIHRANLNKHLPPQAPAAPETANRIGVLAQLPRTPPGPRPAGEWKSLATAVLRHCAMYGMTPPPTPRRLVEILHELLGGDEEPNLRMMQALYAELRQAGVNLPESD
jgi:hypothetical protein